MVERVMTVSKGWSLSAKGIGKALEYVIEDGIRHLMDHHRIANRESGSRHEAVLFCAELQVPRQVWTDSGLASAESALDRFTDGVTRNYWRKPGSTYGRLAVGALTAVESHGSDRWSSLRRYWEHQNRGMTEVVYTRGELEFAETQEEIVLNETRSESGSVADIPWYGGGAFSDDKPEGPWTGWPAALLYVPEFELIEDETLFSLRVRMMVSDAGQQIGKVTDVMEKFFSWFGEPDVYLTEGLFQSAEREENGEEAAEELRTQSWYQDAVAEASSEIRRGAYHKLVLARHRTVFASNPYPPSQVVRELMCHYPDSFVFAACWNSSCFVGASPERLVRVQNHVASVDCLAGTTARGASESEDARLADALLQSAKDRKEHQVVLEWIGKRLERFSSDITHAQQPQIRKLANVQHLHTPMEAHLNPGVTILDLTAELHPTPAVAGTPRDTAMSLIRQREPIHRGWYAGCLGIMQGDGDGEMCVAIRSALIVGKKAILYAGAGIMGDSDPVSEWRETELKLRPMEDALRASARTSAGGVRSQAAQATLPWRRNVTDGE